MFVVMVILKVVVAMWAALVGPSLMPNVLVEAGFSGCSVVDMFYVSTMESSGTFMFSSGDYLEIEAGRLRAYKLACLWFGVLVCVWQVCDLFFIAGITYFFVCQFIYERDVRSMPFSSMWYLIRCTGILGIVLAYLYITAFL